MTNFKQVIIGCGDVGRRIAAQLLEHGEQGKNILGLVNSQASADLCESIGIQTKLINLDQKTNPLKELNKSDCYYLVAPQKEGMRDERSRSLLKTLTENEIRPNKIVLISTTGVYGDCDGEWVSEQTKAQPKTERGNRRLDSEQQWNDWCQTHNLPLAILRVPGIYANSRLPKQRLEKGIPVVKLEECGFTNRIHADDLAMVAITAMQTERAVGIYNVTDGAPGKISEYLQAAAMELGLPVLPEISMRDAQSKLSAGMLSYLSESRRISNEKMLNELKVKLRYPNFQEGLKFG